MIGVKYYHDHKDFTAFFGKLWLLVGVKMSFRVIHHEGDKDLLIEKVRVTADQLKNDEYKDCFDFDECEWEHAVDSVANVTSLIQNMHPLLYILQ